MAETSEDWFWALCESLESKPSGSLTELELAALEFRELRNRAGGEGSFAYYTDSLHIKPSRVAALLARFAPPDVAAAARFMSNLCPDDAPQDPEERGRFLEDRIMRMEQNNLPDLPPPNVDAAEVLDGYCMGQGAQVLYEELRRLLASR